jgi:hypothetical protein
LIADNVYAGTATMDYQAETSEAFPWPGFPDRSLTCQTTAEGAPQSSPKVIVTFGSAGVPTVEFVVDPAHPDAFNAYERRTCADGTDQLLPFPPMIGSHPEVAWQLPGTAIIAERLWHEPTNNYPPGWDADVYELIRVSAATARSRNTEATDLLRFTAARGRTTPRVKRGAA